MVYAELYHQMIHVGNAIGSTQRIEEFQLGLWWLHVIGIVRWFWCWKMFKAVIFSVQTYHKGFGCVFWWVKRGKAKVGPLKNSGDQTCCAGKPITQFDDVPVLKTSDGITVFPYMFPYVPMCFVPMKAPCELSSGMSQPQFPQGISGVSCCAPEAAKKAEQLVQARMDLICQVATMNIWGCHKDVSKWFKMGYPKSISIRTPSPVNTKHPLKTRVSQGLSTELGLWRGCSMFGGGD